MNPLTGVHLGPKSNLAELEKSKWNNAKKKGTNMSTERQTGAERLAKDFKHVKDDAQELVSHAAEQVGDKAREWRARVGDMVESARESYQHAQKRMVDGAKATDKAIRTHPYQTLGIAFGIGLLAGLLINRRRD